MQKPIVLVVDDTPENIILIKGMLGDLYRIKVSTSGRKAIEMCKEDTLPDLILLDIMMPEMNGFEVCETLKSNLRTAKIPIIFISAMSEEEDESKGLALGAVDYITKPISPNIVLQRVKNHIELVKNRKIMEELSLKYASYLSPELVNSLNTGSLDTGICSSRKKLTVFFSDIAGFTHKSEIMSPEDMTFALNVYFEKMYEIVQKYRGTLDKYIGDAMMVFFGDPISNGPKEDALACVKMALEMQEAIPLVEEAWKKQGIHTDLKIRIGIATGFCTVGNFGAPSQMTYTIFGNTVNMASRMESNGVVGEVAISEDTWHLVKDDFHTEPREPLQFKGISMPVKSWIVKNVEANDVLRYQSESLNLRAEISKLSPGEIEILRKLIAP